MMANQIREDLTRYIDGDWQCAAQFVPAIDTTKVILSVLGIVQGDMTAFLANDVKSNFFQRSHQFSCSRSRKSGEHIRSSSSAWPALQQPATHESPKK
jgi:hypothetical protein